MGEGDSTRDGSDDDSGDGERYEEAWPTDNPESIPTVVAEAVAAAKGTTPEQLTPPLADSLNVDALVRLLRSGEGSGTIEVGFTYHGRSVTLRDDGTVTVGPDE
jgi:hypothetical protein